MACNFQAAGTPVVLIRGRPAPPWRKPSQPWSSFPHPPARPRTPPRQPAGYGYLRTRLSGRLHRHSHAPPPPRSVTAPNSFPRPFPDGTTETAGASFTKTWRLKNIGACTWTSSYAVVFVSGNAMNAPSSVPLSGNVAPRAGSGCGRQYAGSGRPGNYTGTWTLRNASGVLFGLGTGNGPFWVKIDVVSPTATAPLRPGRAYICPSSRSCSRPTARALPRSSVQASAVGHAVAVCPSGSKVTGGGFAGNSNLLVYSSFASGNGWEVDAQNLSASVQPLNAYAECLSNSPGTTAQVVSQVTAAAGGTGHAVANCPSGSVVTGGGFAGNSNLLIYSNSVTGNWLGGGCPQYNSASSQLLNAYAVCLSGTSGSTQQVVSPGQRCRGTAPAHAVAACPSGTYLTGGGYAGNLNLFVFTTTRPRVRTGRSTRRTLPGQPNCSIRTRSV